MTTPPPRRTRTALIACGLSYNEDGRLVTVLSKLRASGAYALCLFAMAPCAAPAASAAADDPDDTQPLADARNSVTAGHLVESGRRRECEWHASLAKLPLPTMIKENMIAGDDGSLVDVLPLCLCAQDALVDAGADDGSGAVQVSGGEVRRALDAARITEVHVAGMATEGAVAATARAALEEGWSVAVLEDVAVSDAPEVAAAALVALEGEGVRLLLSSDVSL